MSPGGRTRTSGQLNVAPTDLLSSMGTVHVSDAPLLLQSPVHPRKRCFLAGLAVNVTVVFAEKVLEHCLPQLIPFGLLVTIPLPVLVTVSAYCGVASSNVAVTDWAALIV